MPISTVSERQMLKTYRGYATVIDSRVICVRPYFRNMTRRVLQVYEDAYDRGQVFSGFIGPDPELDLPGLDTGNSSLHAFRCKAPGGSPSGLSAAICAVDSTSSLVSSFAPDALPDDMFRPGNGAFLVVQTPGSRYATSWWDATATIVMPSDSEWLLWTEAATPARFSLCYTNSETHNLPIDATRETNASEPSFAFDSVYGNFITGTILEYLGAPPTITSALARTRPVLSLQSRKWSVPETNADSGGGPDEAILGKLLAPIRGDHEWGTKNVTVLMCQDCIQDPNKPDVVTVNQQLGAIFSGALNRTGHPSFALQSLLSTLHIAAYYDVMPQLTLSASISTTSYIETFVPTTILPLIGVALLLLFHLLVTIVIVIFFAKAGTLSPLNNVWLAVAQLLHADDISQCASWHDAASLTEDEIEVRMTKVGLIGQYYKLTTAHDASESAGWVKRRVDYSAVNVNEAS